MKRRTKKRIYRLAQYLVQATYKVAFLTSFGMLLIMCKFASWEDMKPFVITLAISSIFVIPKCVIELKNEKTREIIKAQIRSERGIMF